VRNSHQAHLQDMLLVNISAGSLQSYPLTSELYFSSAQQPLKDTNYTDGGLH